MYMTITPTVTALYEQQQFKFFRGVYNILDCGVRTGKTYWAMNHLREFTRDGQLWRILFLVDTTALKDNLIENYPDDCCDADMFWCGSHDWGAAPNKIGIMCYQALGMRAIKEDLGFLEEIDVICWDECDSVFNFAASAFAKARKYDFARQDSTNEEILAVIQRYSSKKEYMPLILLGRWEHIINDNRILCIGLSASPERARLYYASLVHDSYKGKIYTGYRAANDIYFKNVLDHIQELIPQPGVGYWCYSPSIQHNRMIVNAANNRGFKAIELHSLNNVDEPMTPEQLRVSEMVVQTGYVPEEYDFVVVTKAFERGININDPRFKHLIVNSYYQEDRIQAARQTFPYQRHVKVITAPIPEKYIDRWLTVDECRALAEEMAVRDYRQAAIVNKNTTRILSWNKLKELLTAFGYTIEKQRKRLNGAAPQQCYRITGEWSDREIVSDNSFMELVAAKTGDVIEGDNIELGT